MRNWLRRLNDSKLAKLAVFPVALFVLLRWFEQSQVYAPSKRFSASASDMGWPCEEVRFQAADGTLLHAWFFPALTNAPHAARVFLYCHGNAGNISHRLEFYDLLLQSGAGVFAFDYRGYGQSEGCPSENGTYLDAEAACAWLIQKGVAATNIFLFGESLGGAVAAEIALRKPVGGLMLVSSFTSAPRLGAELFPWLPVKWIARIHYDTLGKLPRIRVPVFFMHSRADTIIPFHHAEQNFAAAAEPRKLFEIAGDHNDALETDARLFQRGIEDFLRWVGANEPKQEASH